MVLAKLGGALREISYFNETKTLVLDKHVPVQSNLVHYSDYDKWYSLLYIETPPSFETFTAHCLTAQRMQIFGRPSKL